MRFEEGNEVGIDFSSADIVIAHTTCWSGDQMNGLSDNCLRMKAGAVLVTFSVQPDPLISSAFETVSVKQFEMQWGWATVFFFRKLGPNATQRANLCVVGSRLGASSEDKIECQEEGGLGGARAASAREQAIIRKMQQLGRSVYSDAASGTGSGHSDDGGEIDADMYQRWLRKVPPACLKLATDSMWGTSSTRQVMRLDEATYEEDFEYENNHEEEDDEEEDDEDEEDDDEDEEDNEDDDDDDEQDKRQEASDAAAEVRSLLAPGRTTSNSYGAQSSYGTVAGLDHAQEARVTAAESATAFRSSCERAINAFKQRRSNKSTDSPPKQRMVPAPLNLEPLSSPMSKMQQEVLLTCSPSNARSLADERPTTSRRISNPSPSQYTDYLAHK
jgi:hypothetical protein